LDSAHQGAATTVLKESLLEELGSSDRSPMKLLEPSVLYQLPEVVALLKPPGWSVSIGSKEVPPSSDTNRDQYSSGKHLQLWVQSRFGICCPIASDAAAQHGIVHRLDTNTSGLVLCAKTYKAYLMAQLQFISRRVYKEYVCLCHGRLTPEPRMLEASLRVVDDDAELPHTIVDKDGQQARTEICAVAHLYYNDRVSSTCFSLVKVSLHTGRRHQIRAHMANEGCPLVGDVAYGGMAQEWCKRVFLHAHRLKVNLAGDDVLHVCCPLPDDLQTALEALEASGDCSAELKGVFSGV